MSLADKLRNDYADCVCRRCKERGCLVKLDMVHSDHVVITGIKYQARYHCEKALCDYIVFDFPPETEVRIAVLELTSGDVDDDDVDHRHAQLQNGASLADGMVAGEHVTLFRPVLAKEKTLTPMASKILHRDQYKVRFRQFRESIRVIRCGSSLQF